MECLFSEKKESRPWLDDLVGPYDDPRFGRPIVELRRSLPLRKTLERLTFEKQNERIEAKYLIFQRINGKAFSD